MKRFSPITPLALVLTMLATARATEERNTIASGVVYEDVNANAAFDPADRPLQGIPVSNGRDIVQTDANGRYKLTIDSQQADIFVIKPRNYQTALNADNIPQFSYLHRPDGSPVATGPKPTGPLPHSVDFALYPNEEPDSFQVLLLGDPQPHTIDQVSYLIRDIAQDIILEGYNQTVSLGISLGDVSGNRVALYDEINAGIGQIGLPWYNVPGNHDRDRDDPEDAAYESFKHFYGRDYYAFNFGTAHFIVLNDIEWDLKSGATKHHAGLGERQLTFIKNDLALVPQDALVVLVMHIPLTANSWNAGADKTSLFSLLEKRNHLLSFSGHIHKTHDYFNLGEKDGWHGRNPLPHMVEVTCCGPWWSGVPDEFGIPAAMNPDGTPNGYGILTINGNQYSHRYKVARRSASLQMHITVPSILTPAQAADTFAYANIYDAWPEANVRMRVDAGPWRTMAYSVEPDPMYVRYYELAQTVPNCRAIEPVPSSHLWKLELPQDLALGAHRIEVEAQNPDGQLLQGLRIFLLEPPQPTP